MTERVFLDEGGVKVTQARFIVPAKTYTMAGVTSIGSHKENPSRKGPIILIVIGFMVAMVGFSVKSAGSGITGLLMLGGGVAWLLLQKPTFWVVLHSASGESRALGNKDGQWISRVVAALNDAVVARG